MNGSAFALVLAFIAAGLIVSLLIAGALAKAGLRRRFPPAGQLVDVGGYRLHVRVEGEGAPTVVLEAGAGGVGLLWELVRPALARHTRVVTYDRAGLGWSEPSPRPRTADVMAEELHLLLTRAAIPGPYVLVGWSLGGPVVRHYAARYPDTVVGLVLVDSAHEHQMRRFPQTLVRMLGAMTTPFRVLQALARLGFLALNPALIPVDGAGRLPADVVAAIRGRIASGGEHVATLLAETTAMTEARTEPVRTLGDLPLIVLSHGQLPPEAVPPSLGPAVRAEYEETWQALQIEMTALSTRGRRIVAAHSGHNIPLEEPELVIDAVRNLLPAV